MGSFDDAMFQLKNVARGGKVVNAQQTVEQRILGFMVEFPTLTDEDIATLARDEIINVAGDEPALLKWATEATVARLKRTLKVASLRDQQRALHAAAEEAEAAQTETVDRNARELLRANANANATAPKTKGRGRRQQRAAMPGTLRTLVTMLAMLTVCLVVVIAARACA